MKLKTINKHAGTKFFHEAEQAVDCCDKIAMIAQLLARANPIEGPDHIIQAGGMIVEETQKLREFLMRLL